MLAQQKDLLLYYSQIFQTEEEMKNNHHKRTTSHGKILKLKNIFYDYMLLNQII